MKIISNSFLRLFSIVLLGTVLVGCVSQTPRSEPRAPVYERGTRVSGWVDSVLGNGQTVGVDVPEVMSGQAVYQQETIDATPATSPTQAPVAEKIAMAETTQSLPATGYSSVASTQIPVATSNRSMSAAAKTLMAKAENEQAQGNFTAAASTLERALRIENHPLLWNRLANVRLKQSRYSLASDLASKSNAIAGSDTALKRNNYLVIAQAKQASGDTNGAADARARANALR